MATHTWKKIIKKFNSKLESNNKIFDNKGKGQFKSNDSNYNKLSPNKNTKTIKIITDEPTLEDALDFERYSKNLAEIIRNSTPRFTIGIFGGWGTGKTSLMKMIEASLLRKGVPIFNWDRILLFNEDSYNLKDYLIQKFPDVRKWILDEQFEKGKDEKTILIGNYSKNQFLSISIDKKNIFASISIKGNLFSNEFIVKKEGDSNFNLNVYEKEKDILTVWFNAWKYEKEKYLAVVPFLRTIKITLDNDRDSKTGKSWDNVAASLEKTFQAFIDSTNLSLGLGSYGSTQINLSKFSDNLRAEGSASLNGERVYYHKHVTEHLEEALSKLRQENSNRKIVVFIDDLDRCHPKQSLEVLDSIKTFFDIEGIVYVIGMDDNSINSIIKEKYGDDIKDSDNKVKKGIDYLQKIVQLPFKMPKWQESDISSSIDKIISKGLEGSDLVDEFKENKELIVRAVEKNPREVKRFINNVILAKSIIKEEENIDKLIAYQALAYRTEWNSFLQLIFDDVTRKKFLKQYDKLKDKFGDIINEEQLVDFNKELFEDDLSEQNFFKENLEIYREIIKQGKDLIKFLQPPTISILSNIEKMERYRRAFDVTEITTTDLTYDKTNTNTTYLIRLLREGKVQDFNKIVTDSKILSLNFSDANLSNANLSGAILSSVNFTNANLSNANLKNSILLNLVDRDVEELIINEKTSFYNAITDSKEILSYLENKIPQENMPILFSNKDILRKGLENRGYAKEKIEYIIILSQK
jgi:hypothetical protein